uniref:Ribosomal protein S24/S35 mitochondrial conserved domain-containing protein n=1 Tax=Acrobeloides nanus TaxID=290746 RepID=A0A914BZR5_9BILA
MYRRRCHDWHGRPDGLDHKGQKFRQIWLRPKRAMMHRYWTRWFPKAAGEFKAAKFREKRQDLDWTMPKSFELPKISHIHRNTKKKMTRRLLRRYRITPEMDWPSHWPTAKTYNAQVCPLPIRREYQKHPGLVTPRDGFNNTEMLKIPNFLHLTPTAIKRHCEAIKEFFTPFPESIKKQKKAFRDEYFPITMKYSDFVHQSNSIRDCRSRTVTLIMSDVTFNLKDVRERTKFRQLAGNRWNEQTKTLSFVVDRCYTRKQNQDYIDFLITALYSETKKEASWEKLKTRADTLNIDFQGSSTEDRLVNILAGIQKRSAEKEQKPVAFSPVLSEIEKDEKITKEVLRKHPKVKQYSRAWEKYMNKTETPETVRQYAKSIRRLLGIPEIKVPPSTQPQVPVKNSSQQQASSSSV